MDDKVPVSADLIRDQDAVQLSNLANFRQRAKAFGLTVDTFTSVSDLSAVAAARLAELKVLLDDERSLSRTVATWGRSRQRGKPVSFAYAGWSTRCWAECRLRRHKCRQRFANIADLSTGCDRYRPSDLPGMRRYYLKSALNSYKDELQARGVQPIVGLLKDMAAIIESAAGSTDADRDWLSEGLRTAFLFAQTTCSCPAFRSQTRGTFIRGIPTDETRAIGASMSKPFQSSPTLVRASASGVTTDDFYAVEKMSQIRGCPSLPASSPVTPPLTIVDPTWSLNPILSTRTLLALRSVLSYRVWFS